MAPTLRELEDYEPPETPEKPPKNRWCLLIGMLVVAALIFGAIVGVLFGTGIISADSSSVSGSKSWKSTNLGGGGTGGGTDRTNNAGDEGSFDVRCGANDDKMENISNRRLQTSAFQSVGCFQRQYSPDFHPLVGETTAERAQDCSDICFTPFFGVAEDTCRCFVEPPQYRLAIGSCAGVGECEVEQSSRMETYFRPQVTAECNQELTTSVRNFLVEEDDAPFGFDLLTNTFKQSPFELYKDECGTNVYEVQTEVSEDSKKLSTTVQTVNEFSLERRSHLAQSISYGASASYKGALISVAARVSGANDIEQLSIFKSSGANAQGSKVFSSLGVKRVAEIKIADFDNKRHFVTFSPQFASLLRTYKNNGFQRATADSLMNTYGHTVLVRGMFGGYMELRTTASNLDTERISSSQEESRRCYELAVSAEAEGFGFSGSVNDGTSGCSEQAISSLNLLRSNFESETSEDKLLGGGMVDGEFVVPPEQSRLLTTRDKYPEGDSGIELRLLSDFLDPDKISPLEVRRSLITEKEFGEIQSHLQNHLLESLQESADILGACEDCEVPYLEQTATGGYQCQCYDPDVITRDPTTSPTKSPTASPTAAARMKLSDISMRVGDHWGLSNHESTRPSIKVGGQTYYPYGTRFRDISQSSWYQFGEFEIPNLLPGVLELRIEIAGHGSDYVWYYQSEDWFKPTSDFETWGQDTNNNKNYLKWKFDVVQQ